MAYEILVGLEVSDATLYQQYREAMAPFLEKYKGAFGVDFLVSKTLKPAEKAGINRVFTLSFPDKAALDDFFNDPEYKAVKQRYFSPSVKESHWLASYKS